MPAPAAHAVRSDEGRWFSRNEKRFFRFVGALLDRQSPELKSFSGMDGDFSRADLCPEGFKNVAEEQLQAWKAFFLALTTHNRQGGVDRSCSAAPACREDAEGVAPAGDRSAGRAFPPADRPPHVSRETPRTIRQRPVLPPPPVFGKQRAGGKKNTCYRTICP